MVDFKMANNEESVYNDPNFAVICSFVDKFGDLNGITDFTIVDLQQKLENTKDISPEWIDLHVRLLRKAGRKSVSNDRWEKALIKFCHSYSKVDAWEIERFGYKKAKLTVKINVLKHLLEAQFDGNSKFKAEVNKLTAQQLRLVPIGRDINGQMYWYQIDKDLNLKIYREDQDDETWEVVVSERSELAGLIDKLTNSSQFKQGDSSTSSENDDSKDSSCAAKLEAETPIVDTGQSKESISERKQEKSPVKVEVKSEDECTEEEEDEKEKKEKIKDENEPEDLKIKVDKSEVMKTENCKEENFSLKVEEASSVENCSSLQKPESFPKESKSSDPDNKIKTESKPLIPDQQNTTTATQLSTHHIDDVPKRASVIKMAEKISELPLETSEDQDQPMDLNTKPSQRISPTTDKQCPAEPQQNSELRPQETPTASIPSTTPSVLLNDKTIAESEKIEEKSEMVASPNKLKLNEDLKEKSERMIPFKKRGIPKDVDTCNSSRLSPSGVDLSCNSPESATLTPSPEVKNNKNEESPTEVSPQQHNKRQEEVRTKPEVVTPTPLFQPQFLVNKPDEVNNKRNNSHVEESQREKNVLDLTMVKGEPEVVTKTGSESFLMEIQKRSVEYRSPLECGKIPLSHQHQEKERKCFGKGLEMSLARIRERQEMAKFKQCGEMRPDVHGGGFMPLSYRREEEKVEDLTNCRGKVEQDVVSVTEAGKVAESSSTSSSKGSDVVQESGSCIKDGHTGESIKKSSELLKVRDEKIGKEYSVSEDITVKEILPSSEESPKKKFSLEEISKEQRQSSEESLKKSSLPEESPKTCPALEESILKSTNIAKKVSEEILKRSPSPSEEVLNTGSSKIKEGVDNISEGIKEDNKKSSLVTEETSRMSTTIEELEKSSSKSLVVSRKQPSTPEEVPKKFPSKLDEVPKKSPTKPDEVPKKSPTKPEDVHKKSPTKPEEVSKKSPTKPEDVHKKSPTKPEEVSKKSQTKPEEVSKKAPTKPEEVSKKSPTKSEEVSKKSTTKPEDIPKKPPTKLEEVPKKPPTKLEEVPKKSPTKPEEVSEKSSTIPEEVSIQSSSKSEIDSKESSEKPANLPQGSLAKPEDVPQQIPEKLEKVPKKFSKKPEEDSKKIPTPQEVKRTSPAPEENNKTLSEDSLVSEVDNKKSHEPSLNTDQTSISTGSEEVKLSEDKNKVDDEENKTDSAKCPESSMQEPTPQDNANKTEISSLENEKSKVPIENEGSQKEIEEEKSESRNEKENVLKDVVPDEASEEKDTVDEKEISSTGDEKKVEDKKVPEVAKENAEVDECMDVDGEEKKELRPVTTPTVATRGRGRGKPRGRGGSRGRGRGIGRTLVEERDDGQSDSSEEKTSDESHPIKGKKGKGRGRGRGRGRGAAAVAVSVEVEEEPLPLKRSQRLQAQREKQQELNRQMLEERRLLEEFEQQQREEDKRRRLEEKEQKKGKRKGRRKKRGRPKKKDEDYEESETDDDDDDDDDEDDKENKRRKSKKKRRRHKGRKRGNNPWDYSSETSSTTSDQDENNEGEEDEDEELVFNDKSDHEFSPESDSEIDPNQPTQIRRARTAKKVKSDSEEEESDEQVEDDKPCSKCGNYDHPEWILLCDKCNAGFHTACLRPPLLIIPDGDWFCPPCEHKMLLVCLQENLKLLEQAYKKREREEMRKKRLAYVGINLDNVLKAEKLQEKKEYQTDDDYEEDNHPKRSCRMRRDISYQFKEFDAMIQSAIQDEIIAERGAGMGKGKDMSNITEAGEEEEEEKEEAELEKPPETTTVIDDSDLKPPTEVGATPNEEGSDQPVVPPVKISAAAAAAAARRRRRHRRLNDLDSTDEEEEDNDSDEDFKGSTDSNTAFSEEEEEGEEEDDDDEDYQVESDDSWNDKKSKSKTGTRRSRAQRRNRGYDSDFVVDEYDSDESDGIRGKRRAASKRVSYRELSDSDENEAKWKKSQKRRRISSDSEDSDWRELHRKEKAEAGESSSKRQWASESDSESDIESSDSIDKMRGKKRRIKDVSESSDSESKKSKKSKKRLRIKDFTKSSDEEEESEEEDDEEEEDDSSSTDAEKETAKPKNDGENGGDNESDSEKKVSADGTPLSISLDAALTPLTDMTPNQRSVIMSLRKKDELKPGSNAPPPDVDLRTGTTPPDVSKEKKENKIPAPRIDPMRPLLPHLPMDYPRCPPPNTLRPSLMEPPLQRSSPSKLMLLDACPPRSSPRFTMLDMPYVHRSTPPIPPHRSTPPIHHFDTKLDRPSPDSHSSPHRTTTDHPLPPPPPYMGDYPPFMAPPYYPPTYRAQASPHERYSPQAYHPNAPPGPPPPPPPSMTYPPPYHQQSPHYSYGPEGYPEDDQYEGHSQPPYPPPYVYNSPTEGGDAQTGAPSGQHNGSSYAVNNLLQRPRPAEGNGEEDEFNGVNDLVSYITGSHENQL